MDPAGVIVQSGQPGKLETVAITGPSEASTAAEIKVLNTGIKPVSNLTAFIERADGTSQFMKVPTVNPNQTVVQFLDVPTNGPVELGLAGSSLKGLRLDAVFFAADGSLLNAPNDDWTQQMKTPVYFQPLVDLSGFASTTLLGPYNGSLATTSEVDIFNNQFADQAYTLNVVDDAGNTTSSTSLTVPAGQIGMATVSTLPDYHLAIAGGKGIAADRLGSQNLNSSPAPGSKASH